MGGGEFTVPVDEISDEERARIRNELEANRAQLVAAGKLAAVPEKAITDFAWPLRHAAGRTDFGYHGSSNFVDENSTYPDQLLDYNCGNRTYDTAGGYNHQGTDFFTWPFAWRKMDDEDVVVVAGAPGMIIGKVDGHSDRNCAMGNATANSVFVQHADGSVAWYFHMKTGSTTVKPIGERVAAGEYLGTVGSSGSSTGPHLHLELYDAQNNLVDPWLGPCNTLSKQVTWAQPPAYRDTAVNALTVGTAAPDFPACPAPEASFATDYVAPGSAAYFAVYLRDQIPSTPVTVRILRPDGSVYAGPNVSGNGTYSASYWYWYYVNFPAVSGTWTFEATVAGRTYTKAFQVAGTAPFGSPASIGIAGGNGQATPVSTSFAAPLRVQVKDAQGRAVPGAKVSFAVPSFGATAVLESRTALTDSSGIASVSAMATATAGSYQVTATVGGVATGSTFSLQNQSAAAVPRLTNIATRAPVLGGDGVMIGGFIVSGAAPKKILVTARGPSLSAQGVAGTLADPFLTLYSGATPIASNDDFASAANASEIPASMRPANAKESAILTTLNPGAYTAIVTGVGGVTGIGIVEAFEVDKPESPLINIATRAPVLTGDNVMIGGFIIQGDAPKTVVVRARGPSLAPAGVPGVLADPTMTLYSGATVIAGNDNWQTNPNASAIQSSGFAPSDAKESALLMTLNPGAYTVIVTGANGATGIGIVEVFAQ